MRFGPSTPIQNVCAFVLIHFQERFQICVFDENAQHISVDGRRRIEMYAFSNDKRISLDGTLVIRFVRKLPGVLFCSSCGIEFFYREQASFTF